MDNFPEDRERTEHHDAGSPGQTIAACGFREASIRLSACHPLTDIGR